MNAKLTRLDYGPLPDEIPLDVLPLVIGRSCESQVCLDDRWVSRRHCEVSESEGMLVVRDLGSKYGTFVNGCQVRECQLASGDMLSIGLSNFVASYEASPSLSKVNPRDSGSSVVAAQSARAFQLVGQA